MCYYVYTEFIVLVGVTACIHCLLYETLSTKCLIQADLEDLFGTPDKQPEATY
jgi:hypothetical protein